MAWKETEWQRFMFRVFAHTKIRVFLFDRRLSIAAKIIFSCQRKKKICWSERRGEWVIHEVGSANVLNLDAYGWYCFIIMCLTVFFLVLKFVEIEDSLNKRISSEQTKPVGGVCEAAMLAIGSVRQTSSRHKITLFWIALNSFYHNCQSRLSVYHGGYHDGGLFASLSFCASKRYANNDKL